MFRTALLMAVVAAGPADYSSQGANWDDDACVNGVEQSPIDLTTTGWSTSSKMALNGWGYEDETVAQAEIDRSTTKVQSPLSKGNFNLHHADGTVSEFGPLQFHFHAPSEHTVDGTQYDLEVHFVHLYRADNGLGGVIGVFFDRSAGNEDNEFLEALWDTSGDTLKVPSASFLEGIDMSKYWNYEGSLTTPPCTEGVKWTVIEQVQPISDRQLAKFSALWADKQGFDGLGNYRDVQPLN